MPGAVDADASPPPRRRRLLKVLAVNVIAVVALAAGAEVAVRKLAPDVVAAGADATLFEYRHSGTGGSWTLRPNASGMSYGVRVAADDEGYWAYSSRPADSSASWLLLGDSVTMGLGVTPDSTFAGRLAAHVQVRNPSILGWSAADYRRAAGWAAPSVDRAVLVWCLNDLYPDGQPLPQVAADETRATAPAAPAALRARMWLRRVGSPVFRWLDRHSRAYRWARTVPTRAAQRQYAYDRSLYVEPVYQPARDAAFEALLATADSFRQAGVPLTVVLVPGADQLRTRDWAPQDTVRHRLRGADVELVDLADVFVRAGPEGLFLTGDGLHLSTAGHRVVARALAERTPTERRMAPG